jgi:hypothetical protein
MSKQYRKKPVVIEAMQLTVTSADEVLEWLRANGNAANYYSKPPMRAVTGILIKTLEGDMIGGFDDYIIKGVAGEFYPCKPDIFAETYEPVNDLVATDTQSQDKPLKSAQNAQPDTDTKIDEIREAIFWQLNNLLCNTTPEMCEEAREIEAAGSIDKGGRGGVDYTLQTVYHIDQILNLIASQAATNPPVGYGNNKNVTYSPPSMDAQGEKE